MTSIIQHIEYQMTLHDCVVVPGWGALVAQHAPASYDADARVFRCPHRAIAFNASVNHNDGLLVNSIMRRDGLTYDNAMRTIDDQVSTYRRQIAQGREVAFGRLGVFKAAKGGAMEFVPFGGAGRDEYFGLADLHVATLEQKSQPLPAASTQERARDEFMRYVKRTWRVAASVVVLVALTIMLTTPRVVNTNDTVQASLNVPAIHTPATPAAPAAQPVTQPAVEQGRYYLVVCTMGSQNQAQKFINRHNADFQGNLRVYHRGRHYFVYVARGNNKDALHEQIHSLPPKYHDAWIAE